MKGFILDYINENEFRKLERSLKKYNMLAYKKINFEYYPELRKGNFIGELISTNKQDKTETYELKVPSDTIFEQVHGDVILRYDVFKESNVILLDTIIPTDILLEGHGSEAVTYKGFLITKNNATDNIKKIDEILLSEGIKYTEKQEIIEYKLEYKEKFIYEKLEFSLKKYNNEAYQKLVYEIYPSLIKGELLGAIVDIDHEEGKLFYSLLLPSEEKFVNMHGKVILKYIVYMNDLSLEKPRIRRIVLDTIEPEKLFLEGYSYDLPIYKGHIISKLNSEEHKHKINFKEFIEVKERLDESRFK